MKKKSVTPLKQRDVIDTIRAYFKSPAIALDGSRATKLVRVMFERENFFLSFHNFLELQKNITHLYTTKKMIRKKSTLEYKLDCDRYEVGTTDSCFWVTVSARALQDGVCVWVRSVDTLNQSRRHNKINRQVHAEKPQWVFVSRA